MSRKIAEITEEDVAHIVMQVAASQRDGVASYNRIRAELPHYYKLSSADLTVSSTRPNEAMWEQKVRNIKSHHYSVGNFIYEGYLQHIPRLGYRIAARGLRVVERSAA